MRSERGPASRPPCAGVPAGTGTGTGTGTGAPRAGGGRDDGGDGVLVAAARVVAAIERSASRRRFAVCAALAAGALVLCLVTLVTGDYPMTPAELAGALFGTGTGAESGGSGFVLWRVRIPRLLLGVLVGVAFGLAGALLQPTLGNPLASPDILGISGGGSAAACFAILMLGAGSVGASIAALCGAFLVAVVIVLLSRDGPAGGLDPTRFLLIGVAFAFVATAVIGYLVTRAGDRAAQQALIWTIGGLGRADWSVITVLALCLLALVPVAFAVRGGVQSLSLGDELARGIGVNAGRVRFGAIAVAVALAALATAATGPILFVAFLAAPIARRLAGHGSIALATSAFVGVVIVLGADLIAQNLLPLENLPAGIVTAIVGAPVLLWLVSNRRTRGGV
ncbi:enterobactin ABC transporter permease [Pseudoclavibacter endophyticus]|uniref:Iron ABC transporter permease n=1 Tax=Pseudoclavibacter endophyticus TaxID=1778590 RepID=A0A6H9WRY1_9MICO|nr:iron ABC transporter permease [Pseudoclavibacter endophyticus]KAB1649064.1 iron ABC transporter permease [Pseudoclavibacter endophyticus]GGA65758.1 enterobactin ABC transporter permease [Pseudoclavibacter endophyticus]